MAKRVVEDLVIKGVDKTSAPINSAISNARRLDKQLQQTGTNMRTMSRQSRAHFAQVGHQIQDIAVQLQMGMNPMMVLGQQGSQLASIFGTKGALIGGFIAVAAVIGSQLIPNLFKASKGFAEIKKEVDALNFSLQDIAPFLFRKEEIKLEEQFRDAQLAHKKALDELIKLQDDYAATQIESFQLESARTIKLEKIQKSINEARIAAEKTSIALMTAEKALVSMAKRDLSNLPVADAVTGFPVTEMDKNLIAYNKRMEALADRIMQSTKPALQKFKDEQILVNELVREFGLNSDVAKRYLDSLAESLGLTVQKVEMFANEMEEARTIAMLSMKDIEDRGLGSLEDGLVSIINQTKSVQDAFKDMARSIVNDLIRMQIQRSITQPLFSMLNPTPVFDLNNGTLTPSLRAMGGPVSGRKPYIVGERGPELFVPSGSGSVVPNNEMGGSGGAVNVTLNISTGVSQTVRAEIAQLMPQIANATKAAVLDARRRGGSFAGAFGA